jgi:hypothetical protein
MPGRATASHTYAKLTCGWGWPWHSQKAHYFNDSPLSLCGEWRFEGLLEMGRDESPDNCDVCKGRLADIRHVPNALDQEYGDVENELESKRSGGPKLTMDQVRELQALKGTLRRAECARRFGITVGQVSNIWCGRGRAAYPKKEAMADEEQ